MIRQLQKRSKRLERNRPPSPRTQQDLQEEYEKKYLRSLWFFSVAHYLGNADRRESPADAYIRAFGYATTREWREARRGNNVVYRKKASLCKRRLFTKFGVNPNKPAHLLQALQRMYDGLPTDYKDRIRNIMLDKTPY